MIWLYGLLIEHCRKASEIVLVKIVVIGSLLNIAQMAQDVTDFIAVKPVHFNVYRLAHWGYLHFSIFRVDGSCLFQEGNRYMALCYFGLIVSLSKRVAFNAFRG